MLSLNILTHSEHESAAHVLSRKLTIDDDRFIILLIATPEEKLTKILEESMLEILANLTWNSRDMSTDFSFVMERYNKFLRSLSKTENLTGIHICLGATMKNTLIFSTLGDIDTKLVERGWRITDIGESVVGGQMEFTNISSGEIPLDSAVFFSNMPLLSLLSRDDSDEIAHMDDERFETVWQNLLNREAQNTVHLVRITTERLQMQRKSAFLEKGAEHINKARGHMSSAFSKIQHHHITQKILKPLARMKTTHPRHIQIGMFILGIIFCIGLLWILFHNIFTFTQVTHTDYKNSLIQATTLIQKAEKDMANKAVFNKDIAEAEVILASLKEKPEFMKSVHELSQKIIALKKEVNGVETANLWSQKSLIPLPESGFTLLRVLASDKSGFSYAIGREGMIWPYTPNVSSADVIAYPPWEIVKDAEITDEWVIYLLMESGQIYTQPSGKAELVKVWVTGQDAWESADMITTFDNKLYLVRKSPFEIFRHTPRTNNAFSPKTTLYANAEVTIHDVAIDGAVYALTPEWRILKIVGGQTPTQTGITLNGIPWEYSVTQDSFIFVRPNLNYFYIMSGKNIWIFKPESKNFRDLKSLTYVAALDVSSTEPVISYFVPRDGQILVATRKGIYSLDFQTSDWKIILDTGTL